MAKAKNPAKVITGVCRSSYMFVRELSHKFVDGVEDTKSPKTCSTGILIPKKDKKTIAAIEKAIKFAAQKKFGKEVKVKGRKFSYPLRDGDEELEDGELEGDQYKKHYFLNARSYKLPQIADDEGKRVIDNDELDEIVVSGFHYHFSITFKGFEVEGNKGVRVELNNIMYVKEGERLDGGTSAEEDFAEFANDSDDDDDEDWDDED